MPEIVSLFPDLRLRWFRYLCNEHIKLGPDIVNNAFYREQFDAVEQCFKVIGFTLEVGAVSGHPVGPGQKSRLEFCVYKQASRTP